MTGQADSMGRAGDGAALLADAPPGALVVAAPSPAHKIGDRVEIHTASCESVDQHLRVTVAGAVGHVFPDGAALASMDDGTLLELCPWFTNDCPNAPAVQEATAA